MSTSSTCPAPSNKPKCPNHACELIRVDYKAGIGTCPVSMATFTFSADTTKKKKDKYGRLIADYSQLSGED